MVDGWKTVKIEEIASVKSGKRLPKGHSLTEVNTGNRYIRLVNVKNNEIRNDSILYLTEETKEKISRYIVTENDVCLAIVGHTIGLVFYVNKEFSGANLTENAARLTNFSSTANSRFVYYYLFSSKGRNKILSRKVGSAQGKLPMYNIKSFELELPSLKVQNQIVDILDSISLKIELNLQMNKTLEKMAMALYKHWFVDFGPFQDGKFVDSELGKIPEGWEVKSIGEVIDTVGGGTPRTKINEYWENGIIDWYSPTDLTKSKSLYSLGTAKKITPLGLQKSSAKIFPKGSLLMSSRATIGAITINRKEACTNQGFITMIPNEILSIYQLHGWTVQNMDLIVSKSNGSTFKEISKTNFRNLLIVKGENIEPYKKKSKSIYSQIENNILENQTLTKLRDTLLPKLISGEIRVKDAAQLITQQL